MSEYASIAQQLVNYYFSAFDNAESRKGLASLYRAESTLSWEGTQVQGAESIMNQLTRPHLNILKTKLTNVDSQPGANSTIAILVTGQFVIDNAFDKPMSFCRAFTLAPIPNQPGGYYIHNDIFRLLI